MPWRSHGLLVAQWWLFWSATAAGAVDIFGVWGALMFRALLAGLHVAWTLGPGDSLFAQVREGSGAAQALFRFRLVYGLAPVAVLAPSLVEPLLSPGLLGSSLAVLWIVCVVGLVLWTYGVFLACSSRV